MRIAFFTTTRADFGIFTPLINAVDEMKGMKYFLFVGGTHLASEHGYTLREINQSKILVTETFDYLLNSDDAKNLTQAMGVELFQLANIFEKHKFDYICILGDRYELLPIVLTSILFRTPIIHLHGGEATEGIIDEQIRHMVTKAAHLHFTASEEYANAVIRMGENRSRVYNVGALSIDSIVNSNVLSKDELFLPLKLDTELPVVLMTFHPVTLEFAIDPIDQIQNVFLALSNFDLQVLVTAPNIEVDRSKILKFIRQSVSKNSKFYFIESLGAVRYHSMLRYVEFVIGNSSSGIVEVPFFRIPTVNIGDRQKGRIRHPSIIDTGYSVEDINFGIEKALDLTFKASLVNMEYKFGDGHAAERIVDALKNIPLNSNLLRKKLAFPHE